MMETDVINKRNVIDEKLENKAKWTRYKIENIDSVFVGSDDEHEIEVVCPNKYYVDNNQNNSSRVNNNWKEKWWYDDHIKKDENTFIDDSTEEPWSDEVLSIETNSISTKQIIKSPVLLRILIVTRYIVCAIAFILAITPTILKMYETSHWFRLESDPSAYDLARDWFEVARIPYSNIFHHNDKALLRIYFFIVPYILCALFIAMAHILTIMIKPQNNLLGMKPYWYLIIRSMLGRTWKIPSFAQRFLGMPSQISTCELLGISTFLILNVGTFAVRAKRSYPRGTRKLRFLVDLDEDLSKQPITPIIGWEGCEIWAKTLGILAIMNLGWYLILPIGRRSVVLEAINLSWEKSVKYHRWIGYYTFILVIAHCAMYTGIWAYGNGNDKYDPHGLMIRQNLVPWGCTGNTTLCDEEQKRQLRINLFGFTTFLFMTIMIIFSLPWIRRKHFEWFYYTHHLFIFVLIFLCLHYAGSFVYLIPGVAVYMVDKLYPLFAYSSTGKVQTHLVSPDVLEVSVPTSTQSYYGGAYVFVNVPSVSWLQWHPFSLTSAPDNYHGNNLVFHIKAAVEGESSSSWTQSIINCAIDSKKNGGQDDLNIRLDGFYGHNAISNLITKNAVVLVGGGIGITPMISIARDLLKNNAQNKLPITILWVVRSVTDYGIFADDLARAMKQYDNLQVRVWITLSQLEPSPLATNTIEDIEQPIQTINENHSNRLQEQEAYDRVLSMLASMRENKQNQKSIYHDQKSSLSSSNFYIFNPSVLQPSTNAIIMALSIIVALSAYAFTWNLGKTYEIKPEEKITIIHIIAIITSIVIFIILIGIIHRLSTYNFIKTNQEKKNSIIDNDDSVSTYSETTSQSSSSSTSSSNNDELNSNDNDNNDTSHEEILISMIRGRIGCRPNLQSEFKTIPSTTSCDKNNRTTDKKQRQEVGVLACGPYGLIKSVNKICNMSSSKCCFAGGGKEQDDGSIAFFTYTEEDWEW